MLGKVNACPTQWTLYLPPAHQKAGQSPNPAPSTKEQRSPEAGLAGPHAAKNWWENEEEESQRARDEEVSWLLGLEL